MPVYGVRRWTVTMAQRNAFAYCMRYHKYYRMAGGPRHGCRGNASKGYSGVNFEVI